LLADESASDESAIRATEPKICMYESKHTVQLIASFVGR